MNASGESAPSVDVLIADDDAPTRSLLRRLLERRGLTCLEAEDGPSAVALAQASVPRCVLLDLIMPGLDGLTVARRLRADPRTRSIHIHCLTGRADDEARALARDAGCEAFLVKPVEPGRVLELVQGEAKPAPTGWVSGLTLTEAGDLLDRLERCGCTHLELVLEGNTVGVCCVCPPGLRLGRDSDGAVRLFPAEADLGPPPLVRPGSGALGRAARAVLARIGRVFRRSAPPSP
jgi:CheY-like chemotaxis protein